MSEDIHVKGPTAVAGVRSNPVAQSGKCSSILEYLDEVSDDPPRHHRQQSGYTKSVPRVPDMFDTVTSSLSLSSTSTSPQQQQRRRRRRRHSNGEESKLGGRETRAPWDNSIKDNKAVKTASSMRDNHRNTSSVIDERSSREAADIGQRGQASTTRGRTEAAHDSTTNCQQHRDVVNRHYSATFSGNRSPLSTADRMADGGVNYGSSEQTLDYSSSTAGTEAPTAMVCGIIAPPRQHRWVWDEWDDNVGGSSSPPSYLRDQTTGSNGGRMSSNGPPIPPRLSPSARTVAGSAGESPSSKRDNVTAVDLDDDECTPAARQAFEDIQATAQSMKANLKERRSEV